MNGHRMQGRLVLMIDKAMAGGGQMHVLQILRHRYRTGNPAVLICDAAGDMAGRLARYACPLIPVNLSRVMTPAAFLRLVRILRQIRPRVLHTHGGTAGLWGRLAAMAACPPAKRVHTIHGIHYVRYGNRVFRLAATALERVLNRHTHAVVCVSETDYKDGLTHRAFAPGRAGVIHNGIPLSGPEDGSPERVGSEFGIPAEAPVALHVGRLDAVKNQHLILEGFGRVVQQIPDARLILVGDGALRDTLEARVRDLHLEACVHFAGTRLSTIPFLKRAHCFVLASRWEGLPLSVLEALREGCPVIAFDIPAMREIIVRPDQGILVTPGDTDALAQAMIRIFSNPGLGETLARGGRQRVEDAFSEARMLDRLDALYERLGGMD